MSNSTLGLLSVLISTSLSLPVVADDDLIALGRLIFFDTNLSEPPGQSCATCHDPAAGWTGPNAEINAFSSKYDYVNTEELGDLGLTEAEELAIVAFMRTLSDGWSPPRNTAEDGQRAAGLK